MSKVTVYTSNTCPYCTMAKDYLKDKEVAFEEKNVQTDKEARQELMAMGYTGVPVICVDDEQIVGFDKARLDIRISLAVLVIGLTTFVLSFAGVQIGKFFGIALKDKAQVAGGIILILLGTKILVEHLGLLTL